MAQNENGNRALKLAAPERIVEILEAALDGLIARRDLSHAVMGIESGDGSFRWVGARGMADNNRVPMEPDTPFMIASVTKLFIAALVLKLNESGKVKLDGPITDYLPDDLIGGMHKLKGQDHTGKVTVRHLLEHSSGIADWLEDRPVKGECLMDRMIREKDRRLEREEMLRYVRKKLTPRFLPQTMDGSKRRIRYSDTNYQILITLIETLSGKAYNEALDDMIFQPLGLENTWLPGHRPAGVLREPAQVRAGKQTFDKHLLLESFGDLYSTPGDLLRFTSALFRGELFDDPKTAGSMTERFNRFGFPTDPSALRLPGWPIEYGLGVMRLRMPRAFSSFKRLPEIMGHTGVTGTWSFWSPELDLYICGGVDQITAAPLPFRLVPRLLDKLRIG